MDLIDRQAAIDAICQWCYRGDDVYVDCEDRDPKSTFCDYMTTLMNVPSAQPERKRGKWIIKTINTFELAYGNTGYEPVYECSECGGIEESYLRFDEPIMPEDADFPKFCPNCGADMREDTDD